jgi:hypothetical protein
MITMPLFSKISSYQKHYLKQLLAHFVGLNDVQRRGYGRFKRRFMPLGLVACTKDDKA